MAAKQINPGSAFDPWIGLISLLCISGPVGRLVGMLPRPHVVSPRPLREVALGFAYLGALVIAAVVFDRVRARTEKSRACCVVMGAAMAMAGALLIFMVSFFLWMPVLLLLRLVLPDWGLSAPFLLWLLVPAFLASYWSGWRYGAWGAFWGACAALLCLGSAFLRTVADGAAELSLTDIGLAALMVLLGAFAGTLGAARFQRHLAKEAEATAGAAAPGTNLAT